MLDPTKLYRKLLRLYPASFRDEYETPMDRQFRDEQREAQSWNAHARLWVHAIYDVAVSAPRELVRELGQDLHFAIRAYRKRPLSAFLAIGALALAIGVSTGVFSVASALLAARSAILGCGTVGRITPLAFYCGKRSRRFFSVARPQFLPRRRSHIFHLRDESEFGP